MLLPDHALPRAAGQRGRLSAPPAIDILHISAVFIA
jgi:hypothetical protein